MNKFESASILAGISPNEEAQALAPTNLHVITGEVVGQSENGKTLVAMDGMVFTGDDSQYVEIDTLGGLEEGDAATILLSGESGQAMTPLAIGSVGSVDRIAKSASDAYDMASSAQGIAQEAKEVAEATGQHFWPDDDGVHVTEVTQDEWSDSTSTNYHSGANVLLNALGQLFRDDLNNLLALVAGSIKSEQFTIEDTTGPNYFTLSSVPVSDDSVIVTSSSSDLSDEYWNYLGDGRIVVFYEYASTHYGAVITASYRTSSGMALYDGAGNDGENIVASFTGNGITIGRTDGWHVVLDSNSFEIYDGATMRSSFSADEITLNALNIWTVLTDEAFLYNPSGISLGSAYNPRSGAGTVMGGFSSSGLNVTMAGNTLQVVETAYASGVPVVSSTSTFTMANVILALTNAAKSNTWVTVSAANWISLSSGWSITSSELEYNAYLCRLIGRIEVTATASHGSGNQSLGTVKAAYRPPARQLIHPTTTGTYKIFVDPGGGATIVLPSAPSSGTKYWFAADYIVDE